jgi:hypothetical protein
VLFARIVGIVWTDNAAGVELKPGNGMMYCDSGGGLCREWDGKEIAGGAVVNRFRYLALSWLRGRRQAVSVGERVGMVLAFVWAQLRQSS